ncbi:hypothetical protein HY572_00650 [Candidatus Micrarchaeota archaeon]|nr:hypothetical protein [Candidatus Micrarchaeota archaeon]
MNVRFVVERRNQKGTYEPYASHEEPARDGLTVKMGRHPQSHLGFAVKSQGGEEIKPSIEGISNEHGAFVISGGRLYYHHFSRNTAEAASTRGEPTPLTKGQIHPFGEMQPGIQHEIHVGMNMENPDGSPGPRRYRVRIHFT